MKKYDVMYTSGEGRCTTEVMDWMLVNVENADGEEVELYAELRNPTWMVEYRGKAYKEDEWEELLGWMDYQEEEEAKHEAEWYLDDETATYEELKKEILRQAAEEGIPAENLHFFYDADETEGEETMTNEKLAQEIRNADEWNPELLEELCKRADMEEEWQDADGDTFEEVAYKAAEKLGVEI